MAITLVQHAAASTSANGTSLTITLASTTAGSLIVCQWDKSTLNNQPTISLSPSGVVLNLFPGEDVVGGETGEGISYAVNVPSGDTSLTITQTSSSGIMGVVGEFGTIGTPSSVEPDSGGEFFGTSTGTSVTMTSAGANADLNDLSVVGFWYSGSPAPTWTDDANYALVDTTGPTSPSGAVVLRLLWRQETAQVVSTATESWSPISAGNNKAKIATFHRITAGQTVPKTFRRGPMPWELLPT